MNILEFLLTALKGLGLFVAAFAFVIGIIIAMGDGINFIFDKKKTWHGLLAFLFVVVPLFLGVGYMIGITLK